MHILVVITNKYRHSTCSRMHTVREVIYINLVIHDREIGPRAIPKKQYPSTNV